MIKRVGPKTEGAKDADCQVQGCNVFLPAERGEIQKNHMKLYLSSVLSCMLSDAMS